MLTCPHLRYNSGPDNIGVESSIDVAFASSSYENLMRVGVVLPASDICNLYYAVLMSVFASS